MGTDPLIVAQSTLRGMQKGLMTWLFKKHRWLDVKLVENISTELQDCSACLIKKYGKKHLAHPKNFCSKEEK